MTCSVCDEEYERCVICHLSIRREDGGLCDAHKYDEQLRTADCRLADHYNAEVVRRLAAEAQIRDLLEEREELLTEIVRLQGIAADVREAERTAEHWEGLWTVAIERAEAAEAQVTEKAAEIRRLRMGNHPAGRALHLRRNPLLDDPEIVALAEALTERDAEHEGGGA